MRQLPFIAASLLFACAVVQSTPVLAVSCYGAGGSTVGLGLGLSFHFGGDITEQDEADLDLLRLQSKGVDASSVEYWNGCIRAWVRNDDGPGEHMEFYNPHTLRRVDD